MERRDLVIPKHSVLVCEEISTLFSIGRVMDINYPYTHICRAIDDRNRISGINFSSLVAKVWEEGMTQDDFDLHYGYACTYGTPSDEFRREKGTFLKPGRLAAAIFPDKSAQEISSIGNRWANLLRESSNADLSGLAVSDTPSEVYFGYHNQFNSCMSNQDKSWFEIYDDLQHTKILYLAEGRNLLGRALLHDKVICGEREIKIMDRIYSDCSATQALFIQYAAKNGYYRKAEQSLGCETYVDTDGFEHTLGDLSIECDDLSGKYEYVPYVDTFCYYHNRGTHCLSTSSYLNGHYAATTLRSTGGSDDNGVISEPEYRCESCGCGMGDDEGIYVDNYGRLCESCGEAYCYCECCGTYVYQDDVVRVEDEYWCLHHAREEFTECESCGEFHRNDKCVDVPGYGYVCDYCLEHKLKFAICDDCGEWFLRDDLHELRHELVCDDCRDENYTECKECEEWFPNDDVVDGRCESCTEEVEA